MDLTRLVGDRIAAHGVEVHDIRSRLPRRGAYPRNPHAAWRYTALHYTAATRHADAVAYDRAGWWTHADWHTRNHGWPAIAYALGISLSGRVFLLRDVEEIGNHAFNANSTSLGVACDLNQGQAPTAELLRSLQVVLTVLHQETPELPHLVNTRTFGHRELTFLDARNSTLCPGDHLGPLVQRYRGGTDLVAATAPPQAVDPNVIEFPTGIAMNRSYGFYQFWERHGGVPIFGYPITDEVTEDGVTVQYFERARFEHRPSAGVGGGDIALGLVGREALAVRAPAP